MTTIIDYKSPQARELGAPNTTGPEFFRAAMGVVTGHTSKHDAERELSRLIPFSARKVGVVEEIDGKVQETDLRTLVISDDLLTSSLIPTMVLDVVLSGGKQNDAFRYALPVYQARGQTFNLPLGEATAYLGAVEPGAEIPVPTAYPTYRSITIATYGTRPLVTREAVADANFDLIRAQLYKAGRDLTATWNRLMIDSLVANAGNSWDTDTTAGAMGIKAVASAAGQVGKSGFIPDVVVMQPQLAAFVNRDVTAIALPPSDVWSQWFPGESAAASTMGALIGMRAYTCIVTASTATNWDYDTNSDYGGIVMDSTSAGATAMARDIELNQYDDYARDLVGIAATMRLGGSYGVANAICKIQY